MKRILRLFAAFLIAIIILQLTIIPVNAAQFSDIKGHWAETQINNWISNGLIMGYSDGSFRPNSEIKRDEFIALVNRAFGLIKTASIDDYSDVSSSDWFYQDIAKGKAEGYIVNDDDGNSIRPEDPITRQEAAVMLAKLLKLKEQKTSAYKYIDNVSMANWGMGYIGAISALGYMNGYPDKKFKPDNHATRAEAITILYKATGTIYNQAGNYGPVSGFKSIKGNLTITKPDINVNRSSISGNLYLSEGIGTGSVTLENVTVYGTTTISGGGLNSIRLINCSIGNLIVHSPDSTEVRVSAEGATSVASLDVQSAAHIEENNLTGQGFQNVQVNTPNWNAAQFSGNFSKITANNPQTLINLASGSVLDLEVSKYAKGTQIYVYPNASVKTLNLYEATIINGTGIINLANVYADGTSFSKKPSAIYTASGISATVAGISTSTSVYMSSISDQYCSIGSTLNVSLYFNPDNVIKSASSDNTAIATVKLSGNSLLITGRTSGTAKVTVTANYSGYSSTNQAFYITVSDASGVKYSVTQTTAGSPGSKQTNKLTVKNGARLGAYEVKKIYVGSASRPTATTSGAINLSLHDASTSPYVNVTLSDVKAGETNASIAARLLSIITSDSNFIEYYKSVYNVNIENNNTIVCTSKAKQTDRGLVMSINDTDSTGIGNTDSYTGITGIASGTGNIYFQVSDGSINQTVTVAVTDGDSASTIAQKILAAANTNSIITDKYYLSIESGSVIVFSGNTGGTVTLTISDTDTGVGSYYTNTASTTGSSAVQEANTLSITRAPSKSGYLNCNFNDGNISVTKTVYVYYSDSVQTVALRIYNAFYGNLSGYTVSILNSSSTYGAVIFTSNIGQADKNVIITIN